MRGVVAKEYKIKQLKFLIFHGSKYIHTVKTNK